MCVCRLPGSGVECGTAADRCTMIHRKTYLLLNLVVWMRRRAPSTNVRGHHRETCARSYLMRVHTSVSVCVCSTRQHTHADRTSSQWCVCVCVCPFSPVSLHFIQKHDHVCRVTPFRARARARAPLTKNTFQSMCARPRGPKSCGASAFVRDLRYFSVTVTARFA